LYEKEKADEKMLQAIEITNVREKKRERRDRAKESEEES